MSLGSFLAHFHIFARGSALSYFMFPFFQTTVFCFLLQYSNECVIVTYGTYSEHYRQPSHFHFHLQQHSTVCIDLVKKCQLEFVFCNYFVSYVTKKPFRCRIFTGFIFKIDLSFFVQIDLFTLMVIMNFFGHKIGLCSEIVISNFQDNRFIIQHLRFISNSYFSFMFFIFSGFFP